MNNQFLLDYLSELIKLLNSTSSIDRKPIQDKILAVCEEIETRAGIRLKEEVETTVSVDAKEIIRAIGERIKIDSRNIMPKF